MVRDVIFSPSFGNRPSQLVGREDLLRILAEGIRTRPGSRERATVILGQRGSGKTVLLWELADRATEQGFIVASPTIVAEGMLERIVEKVQDAGERHLKERRTRMTGGSVGALGFSAGLQFSREVQETKSPAYKLTQLSRKLTEQGKGVLILVDELQANAPEVRQLVSTYQELVGEQLNVALVMAGLPGAVAATLNDKVLTFLNRAQKVTLDPLAFGEVDAFFKQSFDRLGITVPEPLRRQASTAVEGSPYLLQLIGHSLTLYADEDGSIDENAMASALATARLDFENDVCRTTLDALSDKDVAFLEAMAHAGVPATMRTVSEMMDETPDYAQKYRRRLIDAGVVESPRRGQVAFAVPYLEGYLARRMKER